MTQDTQPEVTESLAPWWVQGWYRPGVALASVAIVSWVTAPWLGGGPLAWSGAAVLLGAILVTVVYLAKSEAYGLVEKKQEEARREVREEWHREQSWEHCDEHCACSACRTRRFQQARAIEG